MLLLRTSEHCRCFALLFLAFALHFPARLCHCHADVAPPFNAIAAHFKSKLFLRRAQRRKHIDARPCVAVAMLCCHCRRSADLCSALALPGYAAAFLVLALPLPCIPSLRFALAFLSCASQAFQSITLAAHSSSSGMSSSTGFAFFAFFAALFPAMTFPAPSI